MFATPRTKHLTPRLLARHLLTLCMVSVITLSLVPEAMAYKFNGRRFDEADFPLKVVWVGQAPSNLSDTQVEASIRAAMAQWNSVACSTALLEYDGRRATRDQAEDGTLPIGFVTPGQDPCFPEASQLIGITIGICSPGHEAVIVLNQRDYRWADLPDDRQGLNPSLAPYDKLSVDLPSVLTHEIGHALGLAHPDDPPNAQQERLATMSKAYKLDGGQARLAADDRFGLCALYPNVDNLMTCINDDQCVNQLDQPGAQCLSQDGVSVCEEPRGELGDYCAINDQRCPFDCYISSPAAGTGYCTIACDDQTPCPTDYTCTTSAQDNTVRFCLAQGGIDQEEAIPECGHARGDVSMLSLVLMMIGGWGWRRVHALKQRSSRPN